MVERRRRMGMRTSSSLTRVFSSWLVGVPQTGGGGGGEGIGRKFQRRMERGERGGPGGETLRRGEAKVWSRLRLRPRRGREGLLLMMKVAWCGIGGRWLSLSPPGDKCFPKISPACGQCETSAFKFRNKKPSILYRTKKSWRLV